MAGRKRIVYLLGAGATEAEISNIYPTWSTDGILQSKQSLTLSSVSKRVCDAAHGERWFKDWESSKVISDIELFISLIKNNRVDTTRTVKKLQELFERDICSRLSATRLKKFYLHKALFELHKLTEDREELVSIISLNYDNVLDDAYRKVNF